MYIYIFSLSLYQTSLQIYFLHKFQNMQSSLVLSYLQVFKHTNTNTPHTSSHTPDQSQFLQSNMKTIKTIPGFHSTRLNISFFHNRCQIQLVPRGCPAVGRCRILRGFLTVDLCSFVLTSFLISVLLRGVVNSCVVVGVCGGRGLLGRKIKNLDCLSQRQNQVKSQNFMAGTFGALGKPAQNVSDIQDHPADF